MAVCGEAEMQFKSQFTAHIARDGALGLLHECVVSSCALGTR